MSSILSAHSAVPSIHALGQQSLCPSYSPQKEHTDCDSGCPGSITSCFINCFHSSGVKHTRAPWSSLLLSENVKPMRDDAPGSRLSRPERRAHPVAGPCPAAVSGCWAGRVNPSSCASKWCSSLSPDSLALMNRAGSRPLGALGPHAHLSVTLRFRSLPHAPSRVDQSGPSDYLLLSL